MPEASDLQHHYVDNTALSYFPNSSVTSKEVNITAGSNVMTSQKGYLERRNGFGYYETDTTFTFSGTLKRFFTWRRWTSAAVTLSGAYFVMFNDVGAAASRVYKQRVDVPDAYPSLIHTDATTANPFDFCVSNDFLFFGNGVDMKKWDGTTVTNWGITAPASAVTVTTTTGALSPVIGYQYQIAWENSGTTHISSPSPASTSTANQSSKNFILTGNTTTDAQVDKVRIFRTVDGGSIYFEHPSSPVTYATWTASGLTDSSADSTLSANIAPLPNQNNRPTASNGPVWFANRIWTFINDTVYYSDFEELVRGVEEESFSSINSRYVGREITGLAVAGTFLLIFTADVIYRIYGDSLATFRFDVLAYGKGCLNRAAIISFRGLVAWLDSSSTVWVTDGQTMPEQDISYPIRSDISAITHATAAMAFHSTGNTHWLILMSNDGNSWIFDLDTKQWMPPWPITATTAAFSGQTAAATYKLFLAKSNQPLAQNTAFLDAGASYTASITTNLFDLIPAANPSGYGVIDHLELETNSVTASTPKYLTDEDPSGATYTSFAQAGVAPPHRVQGVNLVENWYMQRSPAARRVSVQINWAAANSSFKLYGMALAFEPVDANV